jgi:hypothetical protein
MCLKKIQSKVITLFPQIPKYIFSFFTQKDIDVSLSLSLLLTSS